MVPRYSRAQFLQHKQIGLGLFAKLRFQRHAYVGIPQKHWGLPC
jgi:hypothetical protein